MTKKQLKRLNEKERTINELALLLPAFDFMFGAMKKGLGEDDEPSRDYMLARQICSILSARLMVYKPLQQQAIDKWNDTTDTHDVKLNLFLCGLSLLSTHMEVKNKRVNIGLNNEIVELQELCFEFFDTDKINESLEWAEDRAMKLGF